MGWDCIYLLSKETQNRNVCLTWADLTPELQNAKTFSFLSSLEQNIFFIQIYEETIIGWLNLPKKFLYSILDDYNHTTGKNDSSYSKS